MKTSMKSQRKYKRKTNQAMKAIRRVDDYAEKRSVFAPIMKSILTLKRKAKKHASKH